MKTLIFAANFAFSLSFAQAAEFGKAGQAQREDLADSLVAFFESASSCRKVGGISDSEYVLARHTIVDRLSLLIGRRSALLVVDEWEAPVIYGSDGSPQFEAFKKQAEEAFDDFQSQLDAEQRAWIRRRCSVRILDADYLSAVLAEKLTSLTPPP